MKTKMLILVALIVGLLITSSAMVAHHGAAAFDMSKPVVLKDAMITQLVWINPHPLIKADYKDQKGEVQHWTMEMGSIPSSQLIGWTRTTLKPGDVVTLYVWQAKTRATVGRFNKVVLADGTTMRDTQTGADDGGRADTDVGR
jgi:ferric-dicitrate binding protein FerR (iron transport regulator)